LDAIKNQDTLQGSVDSLKKSIAATNTLIGKVRNKPALIKTRTDNDILINETLKKSVTDTQIKIDEKDEQIKKEREALDFKKREKKQYEDDLSKYKKQYQLLQDRQDIYEI